MFNPRINYSWIMGRQSFKTGYEYQAINTQIDDFNPKYGRDTYAGQFSRPAAAAADTATYNLADFMLGLRSSYAIITPFLANLRQRMHFGYLQDDIKVNGKLTLNAGLRYEYATPQYEKDNFLTNFDPSNNSLSSPRTARSTTARWSTRIATTSRRVSAPPGRWTTRPSSAPATASATSTSTAWAARTCSRSTARTSSASTSTRRITQPLCAGNANPTTCFRTTQQGYPEGFTTPASFNPLNVRVNYIPKDTPTGNVSSWHASVQREILNNLLVDVGYVGNRSRDILILGDFNQARPNDVGRERLAAGAPADRRSSRKSRPPSPAARVTTTRCRSRWSAAIRAASIC